MWMATGRVWQNPTYGHTCGTRLDPPEATSVGEKSHPCPHPPGFKSPVGFFTQANTFIKHSRIVPQARMYWHMLLNK
jgi:hypothetical protein